MRIAVLSDIHANLTALQAVLRALEPLQPDAIWCLGDVVGYGPEPQACAEIVAARASLCLAGNHDLALVDRLPLEEFTDHARAAIVWQRQRLSDAMLEWLRALPTRCESDGITLAHGSPREPDWEYISDPYIAAENYGHFETMLCLVGHTHVACGWCMTAERDWIRVRPVVGIPTDASRSQQEYLLDAEGRWLLNPGSVGQPRDGDPRASFALLDTETLTWTWHRTPYDIAAVASAIRAAGLPRRLGQRLYTGS